jgi:hypothetical protein
MAEEKKEKKIAALLRRSDTTEQTATQVVSNNNLSSDKIVETKSEVGTDELATRVSGVESLIPKLDVKIGRVSKKVDNLKASTNRKFERITKEIDIVAEGIDSVNKKTTKLSALIEKNKSDKKESNKFEKSNNKIITILTNMLDFMKLTYEEDKLAREQQNNFSEEQKAENDRRDKQLLEALKGKKKPTAEKIDDKDNRSFLEKILDAMSSILSPLKTFMSAIGTLFSTLSKIFTSVTKFISTFGRILFTVGRFFLMNPVGIALLLGVAATAALFTLLVNDKNPEETSKMIGNAANPDAAMAEAIMKTTEATDENAISAKKTNLLADRPSDKKSLLFWKDSDLQKAYLQEIGWDEKTGTTKKERDAGAIKIDADGKLVYKVETPKAETPVSPKVEPSTPSSTEEGMKNYKSRAPSSEVSSETTLINIPSPSAPPVEPVAPPVTPPVTPVTPVTPPVTPVTPVTPTPQEVPAPVSSATPMSDTPNLGTQMATMSTENALTKTVEELGVASSSQVNNIMAATKRIVEHTIDKVPSVRNQEETFQRMIFNSTRVV